MQVTFTNGKIAVTKDLIFGLCAFVEYDDGSQEWLPLEQMTKDQLDLTVRLIDNNPTFPWKDELSALVAKKAA